MKMRRWWRELPGQRRQRLITAAVVAGIVVVALSGYLLRGGTPAMRPPPADPPMTLKLSGNLMEDAVMDAVDERVGGIEARVAALPTADDLVQIREALAGIKEDRDPPGPQTLTGAPPVEQAHYPPPPAVSIGTSRAADSGDDVGPPVLPKMVGGITRGQNPNASPVDPAVKKKRQRKYPFGPGFMKAKLLTGFKAPTMDGADRDPIYTILRVQAPAVLPNDVRADTVGCLVVAQGYGHLGTQRVNVRLTSMTCMDEEGRALINERLKGYVADADGAPGLAGIPVSKMGANILRLFVAGLIGGLGESIESQSLTQSVSPLGTTETVDADRTLTSGLGRGVGAASRDVRQIFIDLARQTAPYINVGAAKDVEVVVVESVELEVHEYGT